jgi:hypothetical protein
LVVAAGWWLVVGGWWSVPLLRSGRVRRSATRSAQILQQDSAGEYAFSFMIEVSRRKTLGILV